MTDKTPMPGVTPALGKVFAEAAAVCLEYNGHSAGILLRVNGHFTCKFRIIWSKVTDQQRRAYNDLQFATEFGAYGLAIFILHDQTREVVLVPSRKGTGFDFWFGKDDGTGLQDKSRLEVSGILAGGEKEISSRVRQKLKQISRSNNHLRGYVAVIEFSKPKGRVVATDNEKSA